MTRINRRAFLSGVAATGAALAASPLPQSVAAQPAANASSSPHDNPPSESSHDVIDFRYAPLLRQTAFCFPDDPYKSLLNQAGELLYEYPSGASALFFALKIGFALDGMNTATVLSQQLESPSIPIVRTTLTYPGVSMLLITFATNDAGEGRVDNVIVEVTPHSAVTLNIEPLIDFDTLEKFDLEERDGMISVLRRPQRQVLLVGKVLENNAPSTGHTAALHNSTDRSEQLAFHRGQASKAHPWRAFFRFPLAQQDASPAIAALAHPEKCLESCRAFWKSWSATLAPVAMTVPGRQGEFVQACARNILQAREVRDGKLTFQVGPTCYRGLWVVDGNFILEAARYLGHDKEAMEGLRTTWAGQLPNGQVVGSGGKEHWKDTAIAMFTLVRQCELSQDWSPLRELEPQVVHAVQFLRSLQAEAIRQDSALGRYGLLARGFADGGIGGLRDEFTNTLWALAGLKAITQAAEQR